MGDYIRPTRVAVVTAQPGDFSRYRFRLDDPLVDPYFSEVGFSFKANCPSELDCAPRPHECPEEDLVDYPVNYLARDFWSIRQALLDFASDRHPAWKDRLEADLGMMLAEVMSAMGDEFAYYQDRISREGYFESASQRRSLRRHLRMIDYFLHDGKGGSTWLDFEVDDSLPVHQFLRARLCGCRRRHRSSVILPRFDVAEALRFTKWATVSFRP